MAIAAEIQRAMQDSSWIRRMFELGIALRQERGAENVFDLSLGNPITEPPPQFFDELRNYAADRRRRRSPLHAQRRIR